MQQFTSADPFILLDALAHQHINMKDVLIYARSVASSELTEVLSFAASLVGMEEEDLVKRLRQLECFPDDYLVG
jgi:hypothetical protein